MAETTGFSTLIAILYLLSAALFIFALKGLTRVRSARRGNGLASLAMLIAIVATLLEIGIVDYRWILLGVIIGTAIGGFAALRVQMTEMPEMVALFNGCGGAASAVVAMSTLWLLVIETESSLTAATVLGNAPAFTIVLSILIGGVTFSGSIVAFMKLRGMWGIDDPILIPGRHVINGLLFISALVLGYYFAFMIQSAVTIELSAIVVLLLALVLGIMLVIPIGGADMPVVISLLNSYSGLAAAATGFVIGNAMLIIAGALVGASGLILTQIMCVAMNRSLANVIFGGFGAVEEGAKTGAAKDYGPVRSGGPEEAAMLLDAAERVMIVPGYGLAVAQAQHTVKEMADILEQRGIKTEYAIHPVAGRMPGHMNVLLAEADVPYEDLLEMERANPEMKNVDVAVVLGANDVVNPAALDEPGSPIAGMPIIPVLDAGSVIVIKRSLSPGFAGIKNRLFEAEKTMMLFSDAKKALQEIVGELKDLK
ncbi:MAG: NAD(P)(+) transhydrogenase (Re/Si-specific) subunit beta [Thermoanaerobaculia bacterium]|nr:NAD(P)(+) transhydrogenase (Re/Si-specific) subunit beta [Thermoanaerobaculia bacterium]